MSATGSRKKLLLPGRKELHLSAKEGADNRHRPDVSTVHTEFLDFTSQKMNPVHFTPSAGKKNKKMFGDFSAGFLMTSRPPKRKQRAINEMNQLSN